jgi:aminopeptidase-like protein
MSMSDLYRLIEELLPLCRSITGEGLRATLRRIQRELPIEIHEVPSGTRAFDWTVPPEWNVRDAWVARNGERVIDFKRSNLHVVGYSTPVRATLSLAELRPHLFSLPEHPDWIPYRTSYWKEGWGFCLSHAQLQSLPEGDYEVCIDATLAPGSLSYGELLVPGRSSDEILISCHVCHPSLANDNLSALAVAVALAQRVSTAEPALSCRFLFLPGTIGPLVWLSRNLTSLDRIKHGLVLACLGDPGPLTYQRSRRGNAVIDRAATRVLGAARVRDFAPNGYDERQYCSPGFDLPVGRLTRSPNGEYPEYHSSADNLDLVTPEALADSLGALERILAIVLERRFVRTEPRGEPELGRRGLYQGVVGSQHPDSARAVMWVLNLADNAHSLHDMAERAGLSLATVAEAARALEEAGLIREA